MKITQAAMEAAAQWWADQLRQGGIEERQAQSFQASLLAFIGRERPWVIEIDYQPDIALKTALEAAGLQAGICSSFDHLPSRVIMRTDFRWVQKGRHGQQEPF
jgi:hypothetical protein